MAATTELAGKVAIVTGGANGIGRGIVERFLDEGARVVIADIDETMGAALADKLGDSTAFKKADVANADQVQGAVDFACETFGGLDVMVNNAGISGAYRRFLKDDLRDFEQVMAVDLFGVMVGSQRAARAMIEGGRGGSIVNITSIAGILAGAGFIPYRAAKAGVIHFTRSIAIELAEHRIRVNCVAPGNISTAINAQFDTAAVVQARQPLQRLGSPEDIGNAIVYLASDRAAQVTGVLLPVDGGASTGRPPDAKKED
ncbi:MAG: SDR family oxidoreductase [Acidimicrobiia bacterium]|nr:SDR family oxidoreductase [Acidimicrobiia bacterium]